MPRRHRGSTYAGWDSLILGGRLVGIPTISDRIAQMVLKLVLEPLVEPYFHPDSYGYRPGKSGLDAVGTTRQRCWRQNWVIDLNIKGFFDNLDWTLVLNASASHRQPVDSPLRREMVESSGSANEREFGGTNEEVACQSHCSGPRRFMQPLVSEIAPAVVINELIDTLRVPHTASAVSYGPLTFVWCSFATRESDSSFNSFREPATCLVHAQPCPRYC